MTYTPSGVAALAVVLFEGPVKAQRHWRRFRHTPSGAAALAVVLIALTYKGRTALQKGATVLAVVLIAYTCKGAAALAEVQRPTSLVALRRWR